MDRLECSLSVIFLEGETEIVAYVPEIPGAVGQGATIEEARESLADALDMILTANRNFTQRAFTGARVVHRESVGCSR